MHVFKVYYQPRTFFLIDKSPALKRNKLLLLLLLFLFEPLEGSNILWHIVGPPPSSLPIFSPDLVLLACLLGCLTAQGTAEGMQ